MSAMYDVAVVDDLVRDVLKDKNPGVYSFEAVTPKLFEQVVLSQGYNGYNPSAFLKSDPEHGIRGLLGLFSLIGMEIGDINCSEEVELVPFLTKIRDAKEWGDAFYCMGTSMVGWEINDVSSGGHHPITFLYHSRHHVFLL